MSKKLIIDGDTWLWKLAWVNRNESESIVKKNIIYYINNILKSNDAENNYLICLQGKKNFRYNIEPSYKKSRKGKEKPYYLGYVKKVIIDNYKTLIINGVETDDVVASYIYKYPDSILMHDDKDELQIPGIHIFRGKKLLITEEEAYYNLMIQIIMGDSTDNIKGIEGYGIKTAEKLLKDVSIVNMIDVVIREYIKKYDVGGLDEFWKNYRLIKLKHDIKFE